MVIFQNPENRLLGHTTKNIFSANLAFMHAAYRLILCSPIIEQTACVDLIVNEHKINLHLLCIKTRFAKNILLRVNQRLVSWFWKKWPLKTQPPLWRISSFLWCTRTVLRSFMFRLVNCKIPMRIDYRNRTSHRIHGADWTGTAPPCPPVFRWRLGPKHCVVLVLQNSRTRLPSPTIRVASHGKQDGSPRAYGLTSS